MSWREALINPFDFINSCGQDVRAQMRVSNDCGLADDDQRPGHTMQERRPAHLATDPHEDRFELDAAALLDAIEDHRPLFLQDRENTIRELLRSSGSGEAA